MIGYLYTGNRTTLQRLNFKFQEFYYNTGYTLTITSKKTHKNLTCTVYIKSGKIIFSGEESLKGHFLNMLEGNYREVDYGSIHI